MDEGRGFEEGVKHNPTQELCIYAVCGMKSMLNTEEEASRPAAGKVTIRGTK